jgi:anti-sigma factor RsiW
MRNCEDIQERLSLYLDNELQDDERATIEAHVQSCAACKAFVDKELAFLNAIRGSAPLHVASSSLRARIAAVIAGPKQDVHGHRWLKWIMPIAAVVLILIAPIVIWRFVHHSNHSPNGAPSAFALMAVESHLRHMRGQLPLEMESSNPQDISDWFANKVNFNVKLPSYQESSGQDKVYTLEGARLVGYQNDYAAYVAYRMKERPISLVITSDAVARPSGGEQISSRGLGFHYNSIDGFKVITWSDRGLTYALVSDLEERGQQSCIVCHQGTKDQDFIEPLKPH